METFVTRFRNITVLTLVIFAQLVLLAWQVRNDRDVRIIRVWAVAAIMPLARAAEEIRGGVTGAVEHYFWLRGAQEQNHKLQAELDRLKIENHYLKAQLATADRARALAAFEAQSPSKMIAARVIGAGTSSTSRVVFVDRGSLSGVQKGMAVLTPDGIVGKILASYPMASQVLLVTDTSFAAGVVSQKNHARGILKGLGHTTCRVDYIPSEEKVEPGESFYTAGDDRVFPRGFPVGQVVSVQPGGTFQEVLVQPGGLQGGLEEVLIVLEGAHQPIPDAKAAVSSAPVYIGPSLEGAGGNAERTAKAPVLTEADRIRQKYKDIGDAQGHKFGEGPPGSKPPDFNLKTPPPASPEQ